jgi:hypothetical protein
MLRHIVMFSCKDLKDRDTIYQGLSLLKGIPEAQTLDVAFNEKIDQLGNDIEVVVYGEFADAEALRAFKTHPLYQQAIDIVRPLRDVRVAADFTAAP